MNLWFWPFGSYGGQVSFDPSLAPAENLRHYVRYFLATSIVWDLSRGICTFLLMLLVGRPLLRALHRVSRLAAFDAPVEFSR